MAAMMRASYFVAFIPLVFAHPCNAQSGRVAFPDRIVIARDSFIDIGPPFHYYELTRVGATANGLAVERVLITPPGTACMRQPATVVSRTLTLNRTMAEFFEEKDPCSIPEKDLHRELKRRKQGLVFSGVNVTMQVSCEGKGRQLRMDILDRDLYDSNPNTPEHTSWTRSVLYQLDEAIGSGVLDRPIFATGEGPTVAKVPDTETIRDLRNGKYDDLFGKASGVSGIVREADVPPAPPPTVELISAIPFAPITPEMPIYPPIARAARQQGQVTVAFDVNSSDKAQNVVVTAGNLMLRQAVKDAVAKWGFRPSAFGKSGQATFEFKLNCNFDDKPKF